MIKKYRVHNFDKFHYSEIGEYIDEHHTDRPLRNDEIVNLLNKQDEQIQEQDEQIQELLSCNHGLAQKQIRMLDKIIQLEKEIDALKEN